MTKTDCAITDTRYWTLARDVLEQARAEGWKVPCPVASPEGYREELAIIVYEVHLDAAERGLGGHGICL